MAIINFDSTGISVTNHYDPIPAGEYLCIITESTEKHTKDGSGQYLELKLQVQAGQFAGRTLFDRLNLQNSNSKAVEIAQRQLSQICHATGVLQVADSEQLHYKPMIAIVKIRPASGSYDAANEIKGYKGADMTQQQPSASPFTQTIAPQAPAAQGFTPPPPAGFAAGGTAPWMQKAA